MLFATCCCHDDDDDDDDDSSDSNTVSLINYQPIMQSLREDTLAGPSLDMIFRIVFSSS